MGSRDRLRKRKARNTDMQNVKLNSVLVGIRAVLSDAGLPHEEYQMAETIQALVDAVQGTDSSAPAHAPAAVASIAAPMADRLIGDLDLQLDGEVKEEDEFDLDDPNLWELDLDIEISAAQEPATPSSQPAGAAPQQIGKPIGHGLDAASAMDKLKTKLANAEKHGVKRGMPGAGGRAIGPSTAERTSIDEQRKIMEKMTGRPQEAPPGGMMKP